ncbi:hypothetical protein [Sphingobacterium multivorum]|uniref:hypothetical protein n=1 Tax=Sphingobacterium multivorum TaxID=28454 RepID=UPI0028AEC38F|nr:hypothetical protein [Sphingobacterium multivorum]
MKGVLNLNNLEGIPAKYLKKLSACKETFIDNDFMDSIKEDPRISSLIENIDNYCKNKRIIGFHYTRAIATDIAKNGLACRTGTEIRSSFLKQYYKIFESHELELIKDIWSKNFDEEDKSTRDSRLYFNFTTSALDDYGAEPLLRNFGGEQVYMPLQELKGISSKIMNIGEPLILKCSLDPQNIKTFYEHPWGRIAVSTFHLMLNPNAYRDDQDGCQFVDVKADDIEIVYFDNTYDYSQI